MDMTLPLDDDAWLRIAVEAHSTSTTYFDTAIRRQILENLRQFQSQHPQGSKYLSDAYRARSKFFRPKTRSAVRKNEAIAAEAFFQTLDVVAVTAQNPSDPTQLASSEIMKALLQHRLTKSIPWFMTCIGAYQDAQVQGIVCSYQYWEKNDRKKIDRPCIKLKPIENIRFDPSADWTDPVNTSPYFIEMIPMYVKDVMARMKTMNDKGESLWRPAPAETILQATTGYSDVVRLQREQGRIDPRTMQSGLTQFSIVWVHRNIIEIDGQDYVFHTLGKEAMLDTPRPLESVWFHGMRPYVIGCAVLETHRAYPSAPVALVKDIQGELNDNANQRSDNVKFAMNKRYLVRRTAQVDLRSIQRNIPSSATMVNDIEKDIKIIETQDVTASAYKEQDRLNLDFDDLAGGTSQATLDSNRNLGDTVGVTNILTKNASQIPAYQLRTFVETWVEPVLDQVTHLEQHYETDEVILALAGEQAQLFQKYGIDTITDELLMHDLTITVNVGMGATNPYDQFTNFVKGMTSIKQMLEDGVLERYGVSVEELIKEVLGKLGYKDGKRFFPGNEDPRITAMQSTIKEMQRALEQKKSPEEVAATVRKLLAEARRIDAQTVKDGVESAFSAIQTAEVITAVPQVAPVADKVLQAAGYVYPVPPGVDPNLPYPGGNGSITMNPIGNKRTGVEIQPASAAASVAPPPGSVAPPDIPQNTSPGFPAHPATAGTGAMKGIETMRPDSAGP
jgi:hypothetical protein